MDPNARDFQFIWRHWCLNGRTKSIILRKKEDSLCRLIASGATQSPRSDGSPRAEVGIRSQSAICILISSLLPLSSGAYIAEARAGSAL